MKTFKFVLLLALALTSFQLFAQEKSIPDALRENTTLKSQSMYVIEREIPNLESWSAEDLKAASQTSCGVLKKMGPKITWLHSYVTGDKMYCVYLAESKDLVKEHAEKGGFPVNYVAKVSTVIDPSTSGETY
ncbi:MULTISPECIES: DUF4242 domain-containing protein [Aestuariibaculum]|uniref:DUF4242 domain-containing protein n=1 Tax=Aestuariibaculum lutulentum TaxID=2920935 RepID=A0ABS9RHI1_9FLAO|nr:MULTISPECIES: DUF4242 domain-containing protein [Aestuariibaculum]MCH4551577.1 DUF4242 domain-containing protein [Aestuariibaculum lutulentum]MCR8666671.1 DUF4242 domain-containing protein [Aestuariibaculum sp. M13]